MTGDEGLQRGNPTKIIRCSCGVEMQDKDEERLIDETQQHARRAHDLDLSAEQVRSMMELQQ